MSFWTPSPMPTVPVAQYSSLRIALNRKSWTSAPPYSSGISQPIRPRCAGLEPDLPVDVALLLPLVRVRDALLLEEGAGGLPELVVLRLEDRAAHGSGLLRRRLEQ